MLVFNRVVLGEDGEQLSRHLQIVTISQHIYHYTTSIVEMAELV